MGAKVKHSLPQVCRDAPLLLFAASLHVLHGLQAASSRTRLLTLPESSASRAALRLQVASNDGEGAHRAACIQSHAGSKIAIFEVRQVNLNGRVLLSCSLFDGPRVRAACVNFRVCTKIDENT